MADILFVEDEEAVGEALSKLLARRWAVEWVTSGAEALENLSKIKPKIIITDFFMGPGMMNGVEFAKQAKERYPDLPIVLLSGYISDPLIDQNTELFYLIIFKPLKVSALMEVISNLIHPL